VPWDELNELLSYVEEAWLALYSRFILPDEERLPLTYRLRQGGIAIGRLQ